MFSRLLRGFGRGVGLRLTIWYSSILALSALFLFSFAYFLLASSLRRDDQEAVVVELRDLADVYQAGGLTALQKEVSLEGRVPGKDDFFVRLASPENKTVLMHVPPQYQGFNVRALERTGPEPDSLSLKVPGRDRSKVLELTSISLAGGYVLQGGKSTGERERILEHFREVFGAVVIPLVLLGLIGGMFLASRALQPIRHVIKTIHEISTGRMEARAPSPKTGDELKELVLLFNGMVDKIEALIKGMRESLDNVAHDLRTPMTRLRGISEMALRSGDNLETYRESLANSLEESERILKMLNTLMDISEAETGVVKLDIRTVPVSEVVHDVVDLYHYVAEAKGISVESHVAKDLLMTVDPVRMRQVLGNLLDNAIKYTTDGGRVCITADETGEKLAIRVKDSGIGINSGQISRIWDRLYRGDQSRSQKGLGLGLSLVKAISKAHGGEVGVESEPGKGSTFSIFLPKIEPSLQSRQ
jgi:signal transduction histidine kinase